MRMEAAHMKSEASALLSYRTDTKLTPQKCKHCGKNHRSEMCLEKFPELAPAWMKKRKNIPAKSPAFVTSDDDGQSMSANEFAFLMANARNIKASKINHPWLIDSGCASHVTFDRSTFSTYTELTDTTVVVGTSAEAKVAGKRDVDIRVVQPGKLNSGRRIHDCYDRSDS